MYVSCKIPAVCWDKHHQMTFSLKNLLFISIKHKISAVVHVNVSLQRNNQSSSDRLTVNRGTSGITSNQDVSWVELAGWQSFIPLWPVAYFIFLKTFLFSLSSSSPFPQCKSWLPKHLGQERFNPDQAECRALATMRPWLWYSCNVDNS